MAGTKANTGASEAKPLRLLQAAVNEYSQVKVIAASTAGSDDYFLASKYDQALRFECAGKI